MRQHKVVTGIGAFVVLGTAGNLTDSGDKGADNVNGRPLGFASVPSAASTPGLREVVPTIEPTTATAPTTTPSKAAAAAAPAATKAVVVATANPSPPKPVVTVAPEPSPEPVVTKASVPAATKATAPAEEYANCAELNGDYPHGVGRPGATDQTSTGNPVTDFTVDQAVYEANTKSDRDDDGIACEKH